MKKIAINSIFLVLAISVAPVFAGDADTPPLRLTPAKIPWCSKAYMCQNLPYGARQVGKGAAHENVAQLYDLYLPGNLGEIDRSAPFYLFVHGGSWKHGSKGGKGGGRPDSAQAGVPDESKLPEAKAAALDALRGMIK